MIQTTRLGVVMVVLANISLSSHAPSAAAHDPTEHEEYDLIFAGNDLSAEEAQALETSLVNNPDDVAARIKLLGYYFMRHRTSPQEAEKRRVHVLWLIENKPAAEITGSPHARIDSFSDPEGYIQARDLWGQQADDSDDPDILGSAASFFTLSDPDRAISYLVRAKELDPNNPDWPRELAAQYGLAMMHLADKQLVEAAKKALAEYQLAYKLAGEIDSSYLLNDMAKTALDAEEFALAKQYATTLLEQANDPGDWNYGNAVHDGNAILGRIALHNQDVESAKAYLLKAGQTPGSPQLDSFGPNMTLAEELLESGESETVIEYLKLCQNFWEMDEGQLDNWIVLIEAGRIPNFSDQPRY